ncbi:exodeoxyribonuclease V subunit alpha [Cellulomonas sp. APG4]|uniref:exodeoxyribonuclease V subunit alpha n=1 Tax=Cellulomonas sp. APG4 TaxID=1538656 RepID=UPI0013795106|nr:exodeoxyribonuclease V subunit alpha [Cellulomonas sp. APG4]NCT91020.1 exodeoxyribonuclease V subunit alpha [Cellulomonas sp. APG4]
MTEAPWPRGAGAPDAAAPVDEAVGTRPPGVVEGFAPQLVVGAGPLLAEFNRAGVLAAADVHVAQRLGRLTGEADPRVLLAVALAVRAVRGGSVCVVLDEAAELTTVDRDDDGDAVVDLTTLPWPEPAAWRAAVERSRMVAAGPDDPAELPARFVDGRLYLDRYWRDEQAVRTTVDRRLRAEVPGPPDDALRAAAVRVFPPVTTPDGRAFTNARQRCAIAAVAHSRLTVLTGGPGTGKTTTVARLLAALQEVLGPGLRVALAAPTGKAAARLQEAVHSELGELTAPDRARVGTVQATTVHRLLGWRPGSSTRFRHDRDHHLPHDLVVVDETSMVSLPLMARLLEALRPEARLLLVGDPDQLASVEAGAVLGDLVARPPVADRLPAVVARVLPDDDVGARDTLRNGVVELVESHRFDDAVGRLARATRAADTAAVLAELRAGSPDVELVEAGDAPTDAHLAGVRSDVVEAGGALVAAARAGDEAGALEALGRHRLLLAHRTGPAGVAVWSERVERWVDEAVGGLAVGDHRGSPWYPGRPLLVTTNDRDTGLYNGDTGVVVDDGAGGVIAVFGDPHAPRRVRPHRLPAVQTVHAMTVHRGQGSQFDRVTVLLPPATSPLLTRELFYTAVTRARSAVRVIGSADAVGLAVQRPVRRASGLREPLDR